MPPFRIVKSEQLREGKVFNLVVDEIEYESGNRAIREVAEHPGGAVAVPLLDDRTLLLIRQLRYPTREYLYELPAGKLGPNENPKDCAARELEEETGYVAGSLEPLIAIYTTPAFCTEKLHLFLARELRQSPGGQRLEEGELELTVHRLPLAEAVRMIERGEIVDAKTVCGILLTERFLRESHGARQR
jgi:ADP-ribose pyrophosphatase